MSTTSNDPLENQDWSWENPNYSIEDRRVAAQIRVYSDRLHKKKSPQWILDLAGDDIPQPPHWWQRLGWDRK